MRLRSYTIILMMLLLFLSACNTGGNPPIDQDFLRTQVCDEDVQISSQRPPRDLDAPPDDIVFPLSTELSWITPNPEMAWRWAGREIQNDRDITVRITVGFTEKASPDQAFTDALDTVAPPERVLLTTTDGMPYACDVDAIGRYIIYRESAGGIVEVRLIDIDADQIDTQYVDQWRVMALQGGVLIME